MARRADDAGPAGDYPPLLSEAGRKQAMAKLKSSETLARASRVIALKTAELRGAVLALVDELGAAMRARDWPTVFSATHEIRGLAGTAGLVATGRIANGLCHYLDSIAQLGIEPDAAVAGLHLDAVIRSARTEDDAARHGDAVAQQLAALVARKLAEAKVSARR
ncbi:MAG: Hpt domain-containing protein [Rhizomicrobium sp.]